MALQTDGAELFRMVVLRGPDEDLAIDPTDDDGIEPKFLKGTSIEELQGPKGAGIVREATKGQRLLTATALRSGYEGWLGVLDLIRVGDVGSVSDLSFPFGNSQVSLTRYVGSQKFGELYGGLYNSWLLAKTRNRFLGRPLPATFADHEDLLRAARAMTLVSGDSNSLEQLAALPRASVLFPRRWNRAKSAKSPSPARRKRVDEVREEIETKRRQHTDLVAGIDELERIEVGVGLHVAELLSNGAKELPSVGTATVEKIASKTPGVPKARVSSLLARYAGKALGDLPTTLDYDKHDSTTAANDLCSSIQLFEDTIREKLPVPGEVSSENRPSIKAIGWGDLVVAKSRLAGYEASEIAHIENALAGESRVREHERKIRTETLVETETTEDSLSEKSLETSDRFELQTEASQTVETDFSVTAGVNTSGKYGLTKVDSSLEAKFSSSNKQSYDSSVKTAQDVVAKSVEKVQKQVRELRRTTTTEEIRELATHSIDNTVAGAGPTPTDRSGVYYWVDKIEEVQLRHYGKRLMVEFYIPEPGVSLIEEKEASVPDLKKPRPLQVGPADINVGNYLCLAKAYGAEGVKAPPPLQIQSGMSFATNPINKQDGKDAESTVEGTIKVEQGYVPYVGEFTMAGRGTKNNDASDLFNGHIAVAGMEVLKVDSGEFKNSYHGWFNFKRPAHVENLGIPVTGRFAGHDDSTGTLNVNIVSIRGNALMDDWKLSVYQSIKNAHRELVEDYESAVASAEFEEASLFEINGGPPAMNREIEKNELKKWAINLMRVDRYDFDAIAGAGEGEKQRQEIDAAEADLISPIVRFFETCFEWTHMSYFLYPYFWGRREAWSRRLGIRVPGDPKHEEFLKAGYARVVVPVMPGFEARVIQYLDSDSNLDDKDRIPEADDLDGEVPQSAEALWEELRSDRDRDTARGNGLLIVQDGSTEVSIKDDTWQVQAIDIGREIVILGAVYTIVRIDVAANTFEIDRAFEGIDTEPVRFLVGSVPYGEAWSVKLPTRLVILGSQKAALNS